MYVYMYKQLKYENENGIEENRIISVEEMYFMFIDKILSYINENRKSLKECKIIMSVYYYY